MVSKPPRNHLGIQIALSELMKRFCLLILLFVFSFSRVALADLGFEMSPPVPLQEADAQVLSATFCHHPIAPSGDNFRISPDKFKIESGTISVEDICAVPGILPPDGDEDPLEIMTSPQGLCWVGFFNNFFCTRNEGNTVDRGPLFGDVRLNADKTQLVFSGKSKSPFLGLIHENVNPDEYLSDIAPYLSDIAPYDIATIDHDNLVIVNAGPLTIHVANGGGGSGISHESPVILFKNNPELGRFQILGYLSIPSMGLQNLFHTSREEMKINIQQFPLTVSAANIIDPPQAAGFDDIIVVGSASWPRILVNAIKENGLGELPHGLDDVTAGAVWMRRTRELNNPQESYAQQLIFFTGQIPYDSVTGQDRSLSQPGAVRNVFFVPASKPVNNECYVYKFNEEGMS